MVVSLEGMSKEKLLRAIPVVIYGITDNRGKNAFNHINISFPNDGVLYNDGYQNLKIWSLLGRIDYEFHYKALYMCEDNLVKVYVPIITSVGRSDSFRDFLRVNSICEKDGTHNPLKAKDIEEIEEVFNALIFAPLYYIQKEIEETAEKAKKNLEAEKEEW